MLVGFTFPAFIYMKLGRSSSPAKFISNGISLNESVSTRSGTDVNAPLLPLGSGEGRDAMWILSATVVRRSHRTVVDSCHISPFTIQSLG